MLSKVSTKTLVRIVGYGGVAVATAGFFAQFSFQKRVRETTVYKEMIEAMRSSEKVVKHLGEPINEGRVSIGEYQQNMRWVSVRVSGTNTRGSLRCDFVPNVEGVKPSQVYRIEIQFQDKPGLTYLLRENPIEDTV